ncbi:unnamed protein product [Lampetra planeri]
MMEKELRNGSKVSGGSRDEDREEEEATLRVSTTLLLLRRKRRLFQQRAARTRRAGHPSVQRGHRLTRTADIYSVVAGGWAAVRSNLQRWQRQQQRRQQQQQRCCSGGSWGGRDATGPGPAQPCEERRATCCIVKGRMLLRPEPVSMAAVPSRRNVKGDDVWVSNEEAFILVRAALFPLCSLEFFGIWARFWDGDISSSSSSSIPERGNLDLRATSRRAEDKLRVGQLQRTRSVVLAALIGHSRGTLSTPCDHGVFVDVASLGRFCRRRALSHHAARDSDGGEERERRGRVSSPVDGDVGDGGTRRRRPPIHGVETAQI